eukprot:scaffold180846_cov31-Prasinocladus_malaysianus.AAC.5
MREPLCALFKPYRSLLRSGERREVSAGHSTHPKEARQSEQASRAEQHRDEGLAASVPGVRHCPRHEHRHPGHPEPRSGPSHLQKGEAYSPGRSI